jgi:hypothetical protein
VATSLSAHLTFTADPEAAFALLTDPAYVEEVATATGGRDPEVSVTATDGGGADVSSRRVYPAQVPSYAKPLVGDTLTIAEVRELGPADADGAREGAFSVGFPGAPLTVSGTLRLAADGATSALDITASIKASVPLVGGKIERFVGEQIERFLRKEQQIIDAR